MTAEELLKAMSEEPAEEEEKLEACVIDPVARTINIPERYKVLGVESDQSAECIRFSCPMVVGNGINLLERFIRINWRNANGNEDYYWVEDITADGENVTFTWVPTRNVTRYKGKVHFIVCVVRTDINGIIEDEWNTTLAESVVLEGLEPEESVLEEAERDIIAQLLNMVRTTADDAVRKVREDIAAFDMDMETVKQTLSAEGGRQIKVVVDTGTAQILAVQNAGAAEVKNISVEGKAQVSNVQKEGSAQVANVQKATEEIAAAREQIAIARISEQENISVQEVGKQAAIHGEQFGKTLNEAVKIRQEVSQMLQSVTAIKQEVSQDKEEITQTIADSLLSSAEQILESVQGYFSRAEALYNSMYLCCDGETPSLRAVTPIVIDGGTPASRATDEGIEFDGGTPMSRRAAS